MTTSAAPAAPAILIRVTFCCQAMRDHLERRCDRHPDPSNCPDNVVVYIPRTEQYGLVVHDGGTSYYQIRFCPWCGSKLTAHAA
jgi:hypothetical protein